MNDETQSSQLHIQNQTIQTSSPTLNYLTPKYLPWPKYLIVLAFGSAIIGAIAVSQTLFVIDKRIAIATEEARPANLKITKITTPKCADCFDVDTAITVLKQQNVIVEQEQTFAFDSSEAQALISQYDIKKVPTYIATGEITKSGLSEYIKTNGQIKDSTFVYEAVTPIYINPANRESTGAVTATIINDPSCVVCYNPQILIQSLTQAGVRFKATTSVAYNTVAGQDLIKKYNITTIPTVILTSDIDNYQNIKTAWIAQKIGTVESDGNYIARALPIPYRELVKNEIVGLVDVIYLYDSSCPDCYKPEEIQKNILIKGFGVAISSEKKLDVLSLAGKDLVNKYKITQVPTVLISPDIKNYQQISSIWSQVGTIENDGWHIFRSMIQLGAETYKDLTTNRIIKPQATSTNP